MSGKSHLSPGLKPPSSRAGGKSPRTSVGSDTDKTPKKDKDEKKKEKDREIESLKAHVAKLTSQLTSSGIEAVAAEPVPEKVKDTPPPSKRSVTAGKSKITASGPTATPTVTLRSKLAKAESENKRLNTRILELEGQLATAKKTRRSKSRPKSRPVSPSPSGSGSRRSVQRSSTVRNLSGGRSGALSARRPVSARKSDTPRSRKTSSTPKSSRSSVSSNAESDREDSVNSVSDSKESDSAALDDLSAQLEAAKAAAEEARQAELRLEQERDAAKAESEELKVELITLAGQLKQSMGNNQEELVKQVEELQGQVLHYQQKLEQTKRERRGSVFAEQGSDDLKERVASLTTVLEALQQENDILKAAKAEMQQNLDKSRFKEPTTPVSAHDNHLIMIEKLGAELMEARSEMEHYKAHAAELERQSKVKGQRFMTNRLNEQVTNLTYQMFYGASDRDEEVAELREKLRAFEDQTSQISKMKKKFDKMKNKQIEKWLMDEDTGEAL